MTETSLQYLQLIAHDVRWRIVQALAHSDLRVHELSEAAGQPQNLVSYHLQQLRSGGLVHERRSQADARAVYYSLDLERLHALHRLSGRDLHPALDACAPGQAPPNGGTARRPRVLFLCTHNSARSQMAEALLRERSGGQAEAFSAGTEPAGVHPLAVRAMDELGIDLRGRQSKGLERFLGQRFDAVITVCDRAREACPVFPGKPDQIHWSFPDPAGVDGPPEARLDAFRATAAGLDVRIRYFLERLRESKEAAADGTGPPLPGRSRKEQR